MGKTRDLFQKIRDIKGTFHAKMGSIKHRNGMDLTEAEDISHLQPDILECEVKWALESITTLVSCIQVANWESDDSHV